MPTARRTDTFWATADLKPDGVRLNPLKKSTDPQSRLSDSPEERYDPELEHFTYETPAMTGRPRPRVDSSESPDAWLHEAAAEVFAPKSDRAIWLQIYDRLCQSIADGRIAPGGRLPGEDLLSAAFGVTRVTLRRALTKLQREGLLEVRKGVGAFVRKSAGSYQIASDTRFVDALDAGAGTVSTRTLALDRAPLSAKAARALGLDMTAPAIVLTRVRLLDEHPVYLTTKYFPASRFDRFEPIYAENQSVMQVFHGHDIAASRRLETRVHGGFATRDEAKALRLTPDTPVLRTIAVNGDQGGTPIEYSLGCWPLTSVELVFRADDTSRSESVFAKS
ncbi:MAG: phosphonate metabolism transcriptional regulator PhnF [Pseudomonadota bacterium]